MTREFTLSLTLARKLEQALNRDGWTTEEVELLCSEDALGRAKDALKKRADLITTVLRDAGFTEEELHVLVEYSWDYKLPGQSYPSKDWEEARRDMLVSFANVMRKSHSVLDNEKIAELEKSSKEAKRLKSHTETLEGLLWARVDRPLEEVFTRETCGPVFHKKLLERLRREKVTTLRHLIVLHDFDLRRIPGVGDKMIKLIKTVLATIDLHLSTHELVWIEHRI